MSDSNNKLRLLKNRIQSSRPPIIQQQQRVGGGGGGSSSSDRKTAAIAIEATTTSKASSLPSDDDILGITVEGGEEVEDHIQPVMASPMKYPMKTTLNSSSISSILAEEVEQQQQQQQQQQPPIAILPQRSSSSRGYIESDIEEEIIEVIENPPTPLCHPIGSSSGGIIGSGSNNTTNNNNNNVQWLCRACNNECLVITRESRCLCGHRRKEHLNSASSEGKGKGLLPCQVKSCSCNHFFYIVGEGSWILRCQCKHKHIDHSPDQPPYPCKKCKGCQGFDSPWVCNCGHRWVEHFQRLPLQKDNQTNKINSNNSISSSSSNPSRTNFAVRRDGLDHW